MSGSASFPKNTVVEITRLDQIPDAELDILAGWGVTGLWLIGLWERSPASQHIKQICGNPEAISSAYSLFDYTIAADLGGEEALWKLQGARPQARHQAGQRYGAESHRSLLEVDHRTSGLVCAA